MLELLGFLIFKIQCAFNNFVKEERGDVNVVSIVVLIAVAVVLALFFKEEIAGILEELLGNIGTKAGTALNDV